MKKYLLLILMTVALCAAQAMAEEAPAETQSRTEQSGSAAQQDETGTAKSEQPVGQPENAAAESEAEGNAPSDEIPAPVTEGVEAWNQHDYDLAYAIFKANAEQGSPAAMTALGYITLEGNGVPADVAAGLHWFRMAAAADEPWAMYALYSYLTEHPSLQTQPDEAEQMLKGAVERKLPIACQIHYGYLKHTGKDDEARAWLRRNAEEEQLWAMTVLGAALCDPDDPETNETAGFELLRKAADKGDSDASYIMGFICFRRGDTEAAKKHLTAASEAGHLPARCDLGRIALAENDPAAVELLTSAAEGGHSAAWILLGAAAETGQGVEKDTETAVRYYKLAADAGDAAGLNELGRVTEQGIGVPQSYEEAWKHYTAAADAGSSEALCNLGRMQLNGIGTRKNVRAAVGKLEEAAKLGENEAKLLLAEHYAAQKKQPDEETLRLYREAAEAGNAQAAWHIAEYLRSLSEESSERMGEAIEYYTQAAEAGLAPAQYALAQISADDRWHAPDLVSALKWYSAAAEQGHPAAMCAMGLIRLDAAASDDDVNTAVSLIEKSAEAGYVSAEYALGQLCEQGRLNAADALGHYRAAAEKDNVAALNRLAGAYTRGELGCAADPEQAFRYNLAAAKLGDAVAQCNLAAQYASGSGTDRSDRNALKWYKAAAENGSPQAQYNLALMYLRGIGTWKDVKDGLEWLYAAASADYPPAQNQLGTLAAEGKEIPRSLENARHWYQLAAENGYPPAQYNLGLFLLYSSEPEPDAALRWLEAAASQGHVRAAWYAGLAYEQGRGTDVDPVKAAEYYQIVAETGDVAAAEALERLAQQPAAGTK